MQTALSRELIRSRSSDLMLLDDLSHLTRLAIREDLDRGMDLTTMAIVPEGVSGQADIVARVAGIAAGTGLIEAILSEFECTVKCELHVEDGEPFEAKQTLATLRGEARDLLTCERTVLNFLGRLCGIATLTALFAEKVVGTRAQVFDTRKTTPGWRRVEKYAVLCGGGANHRMGLFDAILIKDNHLASRAVSDSVVMDAGDAVRQAKNFLRGLPESENPQFIEIEIDSPGQLASAIEAGPDIVLLDNMSCDQLMECVAIRDRMNPAVELEASGGVNLESIASIAKTGLERISVGALTHSAVNLDLGLDWRFQ
ncbi:carboxylating nicotinate-nucleotide diphosphorylase [Pirellulaceae bacterium SH449]